MPDSCDVEADADGPMLVLVILAVGFGAAAYRLRSSASVVALGCGVVSATCVVIVLVQAFGIGIGSESQGVADPSSSNTTGSPTSSPWTPAPLTAPTLAYNFDPASAPKALPPNRHEERATARDWYIRVVNASALARAAAEISGDFLKNGDTANASLLLKKAEGEADVAIRAATDNAPDGWDDVQHDFMSATDDLKDAIHGFRKYLDDVAPSTMADATEQLGSSAEAWASGVHKARLRYESMGGSWSDLPDGQQLEEVAATLLRSAENK